MVNFMYTDIIRGEDYILYLDSVTEEEYWLDKRDKTLWKTLEAGEVKVLCYGVWNCVRGTRREGI